MMYVQPNSDGTIAQIAEGYTLPPFENAVRVPDAIAAEVKMKPHRWRYVNGGFMQVDDTKQPVRRLTNEERIKKLEQQISQIAQHLGLDLDGEM